MQTYVYGPVSTGWAVFMLHRDRCGKITKKEQLKTFSGPYAKSLAKEQRDKLEKEV